MLKEFNDQQLSERVTSMPFMGPTTSRLRVTYFSMRHTQDIYGQLAVYLRLNGVTPPASDGLRSSRFRRVAFVANRREKESGCRRGQPRRNS